jgi:hypothetical protein
MKFSIPTYLSDFSTQEDGRTIARLKVLYVGETADGRIFDEEFSKEIAASLPDCPVVAFYSDIKKDFLGHNSTQYAFGHVPSNAECTFDKDEEDGNIWLNTHVILYTDRTDNIGTIANKIIGHPHSLELDPKTVSYEFIKVNGKTKIHFSKGRVFGLSVLGTEERPAFTGSAFLNCSVADLEGMKEKFENFFQHLEEESRGGQMDEKISKFESLMNAAELSYSEQMRLVAEKLRAELGDDTICYIEQMYDSFIIANTYCFSNGEEKFLRVNYSIGEDGLVTLSEAVEVFLVFITQQEKDLLNEKQQFKDEKDDKDDKEEEVNDVEDPEDKEDDKDDDDFVETVVEEGTTNAQEHTDIADNQTDTAALYQSALSELEALKVKNSEFETQQAALEIELSNTKAQLDAANVELNAFKLQQKQNLIDSYIEDLSEEEIAEFSAKINEFDYSELESKLALSFTKAKKNNKTNNNVSPFDFNHISEKKVEVNKTPSYEELVNKYKSKTN